MSKLEIIMSDDKDKWNGIVKSFEQHDVYYLNEYVASFNYLNEGKPLLVYYYGDKMRLCYTVLQRDIAEFVKFTGLLEKGRYYDWITPYGYGGPLTESFNQKEMSDFFNLLNDYCKSNKIVTQFFRFHPLLQNQDVFEHHCRLQRVKYTVFIDIADQAIIYTNMDSKNRNMVKKAQKNGIEIVIDNSEMAKSTFVEIYKGTMQRKNASGFYYFNQKFFDDMFANLAPHYTLFNARLKGKTVSTAIIMHCNGSLHYHLAASLREYMHLAPNNLLLYTAACWGAEQGYKSFHLGGGVGIEDSLFSFKKSFNKKGLIDFYIGSSVFSDKTYQELLDIRGKADQHFNPNNEHLIQYRG